VESSWGVSKTEIFPPSWDICYSIDERIYEIAIGSLLIKNNVG